MTILIKQKCSKLTSIECLTKQRVLSFRNLTDLFPFSSSAELSGRSKGLHRKKLAVILVASIAGVLLLFFGTWLVLKNRKGKLIYFFLSVKYFICI